MDIDEFRKLTYIERSNWLMATYPVTPTNELVHGKGINDANYQVNFYKRGDFSCPIYIRWKTMVERTTKRYQKKDRRYEGVTLDPRWISFMAFREWFIAHYVEGYFVDKDLLSGKDNKKMYGPDTSVLVPPWLNTFFGKIRVSPITQKKICTYNCPGQKRYYACGASFDTRHQAHYAWRKEKRRIARLRKAEMDAIDPRIYRCIIMRLRYL